MSNGERNIVIGPGVLLIAPPILQDPNFKKAVVLLCEHSDQGSFGLILNHQIAVDMIDELESLGAYKDAIHVGGPVQMDTLHFLHRFGTTVTGAVEVCPGVHWGGDFDVLQETIRDREVATTELRLYLGYAGWTAGQLEKEIDTGGWLLSRATSDLVFGLKTGSLWRRLMIKLGGEYALLANFPDEPRLN
jgi:putative transcriptional regulator